MHSLVVRLFAVLNQQELTVTQLVERTGVKRETIIGWRGGKTPALAPLEACLRAVGLYLVAVGNPKSVAQVDTENAALRMALAAMRKEKES